MQILFQFFVCRRRLVDSNNKWSKKFDFSTHLPMYTKSLT